MARITVEDCLDKVDNRFELVLLAAKRARQLARMGVNPLVDWANDKPTVVALREIAEGKVDEAYLEAQAKAAAHAKLHAQASNAHNAFGAMSQNDYAADTMTDSVQSMDVVLSQAALKHQTSGESSQDSKLQEEMPSPFQDVSSDTATTQQHVPRFSFEPKNEPPQPPEASQSVSDDNQVTDNGSDTTENES